MTDTREYISNLEMPEKVSLFKELYNELAGQGIDGDTELAHVNTFEASLLKSLGGSGTINEITNLREYKGGGTPPPPPSTQTVTQTSEFPTELKPFIKDVLGEAKAEFGREKAEGYLPFQGPQLAGFTPEQQQAFATGREQFGAQGLAGTPLGQASTYYQPALAATALGTAEIGAEDIGRRMDPFLQNVVDIAQREAVRNEEEARQQRAARAVAGQGFLGGTRPAFVESQAAESLQERLSDIQAQGLSSAFQNAQRAAEAQRAREMAGGRQFAGLGESAFQRARGDITGLAGVGEAQQARSQQALDIARREFEEEKAFPQTALQRYGSVIRGFPLTPSQQQVITSPAPIQPSLAQTLLGGVGTGVGLYGAFGGFKKAGGLVGLLGGGTPTNPLRPPYSLFSGPYSRVGAPQYQGGGPIGVNLGTTGGPSTSFNIPPPTAPSATDLNRIMEELQRRKLIGRSAGGLAGLTVSRHQVGKQPRNRIQRLGDFIGSEIFTLNPETKFSDTDIGDFIGREILTTDPETTLSNTGIGDFIGREILTTDPETTLSGLVGPAKDFILNEILTTDPETKFSDTDIAKFLGREIFTTDPETKVRDLFNKPVTGGYSGVEPLGDVSAAAAEAADVARAADAAAVTEPSLETPTPDPNAPLTYMQQLQKLMADQATSSSEAIAAAGTAEQEYLDYLKSHAAGGNQGAFQALTELGLNLMSETPKYAGEGLGPIIGRAGKEPLKTLQTAQATDKALGFKIAETQKDMAVRRAALETAGLQQSFDNRIKLMEAQSKTGTQFLDLYMKASDIDKGDIALSEHIMGSELKRMSDIGKRDPKRLQIIIDNMKIDGLTVENFPKFVELLTKRQSDKGSTTTRPSDYAGHIAALAKQINADKAYAGEKPNITQANIEAIMRFIQENKMFQEPGWIKSAILSN